MNIAQQIKTFHNKSITEMMEEAEEKATEINQDWDNESTEYDFIDGSVLIISGNYVNHYASR